jgi:hypothetical protein
LKSRGVGLFGNVGPVCLALSTWDPVQC